MIVYLLRCLAKVLALLTRHDRPLAAVDQGVVRSAPRNCRDQEWLQVSDREQLAHTPAAVWRTRVSAAHTCCWYCDETLTIRAWSATILTRGVTPLSCPWVAVTRPKHRPNTLAAQRRNFAARLAIIPGTVVTIRLAIDQHIPYQDQQVSQADVFSRFRAQSWTFLSHKLGVGALRADAPPSWPPSICDKDPPGPYRARAEFPMLPAICLQKLDVPRWIYAGCRSNGL